MSSTTSDLLPASQKLAQLYNIDELKSTIERWVKKASAFPVVRPMVKLTGTNGPLPMPLIRLLQAWLSNAEYSFTQEATTHHIVPDVYDSDDEERYETEWKCYIDMV